VVWTVVRWRVERELEAPSADAERPEPAPWG
jgi:hypothetical protein